MGVSELVDQEIENRDNKDESEHDDVECKSEWMKERLLERGSQIPNSIRGGQKIWGVEQELLLPAHADAEDANLPEEEGSNDPVQNWHPNCEPVDHLWDQFLPHLEGQDGLADHDVAEDDYADGDQAVRDHETEKSRKTIFLRSISLKPLDMQGVS